MPCVSQMVKISLGINLCRAIAKFWKRLTKNGCRRPNAEVQVRSSEMNSVHRKLDAQIPFSLSCCDIYILWPSIGRKIIPQNLDYTNSSQVQLGCVWSAGETSRSVYVFMVAKIHHLLQHVSRGAWCLLQACRDRSMQSLRLRSLFDSVLGFCVHSRGEWKKQGWYKVPRRDFYPQTSAGSWMSAFEDQVRRTFVIHLPEMRCVREVIFLAEATAEPDVVFLALHHVKSRL